MVGLLLSLWVSPLSLLIILFVQYDRSILTDIQPNRATKQESTECHNEVSTQVEIRSIISKWIFNVEISLFLSQ